MDFSIPESMRLTLAQIRTFIEQEVVPIEAQASSQPFSCLVPALQDAREKVRSMGLWAPQVPREYGGMGLGLVEHGLASEELGRSPFGHYVFNCQAPDAGNMEILIEFATVEQKERWLLPLVRGECRSCFAMTEPEYPGSNPVWMATTAVRDGDSYVINGHKWFTSGADGARFAIVMAVTDPEAEPHRRASQIIVPADTPGFRLVRNIACMGHAGDDWASHGELRFENCRVPRANLLGEEGSGFAIAQARLGPGRIHHCMRWLGVCERSFDLMCRRAATRELAPGDLLGSRQTIQNWIAESRAQIDAARLLVLHAAWRIDKAGAKEAREDISLIKFHVAAVMQDVIDRAIQVHGALGISDDTVLSWFYRHERAARIYDGPDEVHKAVVARRILKRYGANSGDLGSK
ncbi:MAG TPA: acyl-CoA dehydrogenase family protein [Isosphaeraceae bacterium]|jgi:alkylation response protein AidB-like acyl-CoA dehydrogenase|nr:acyl-CoA dehydrogenase family protein [Isosphaeraceae bacterium]